MILFQPAAVLTAVRLLRRNLIGRQFSLAGIAFLTALNLTRYKTEGIFTPSLFNLSAYSDVLIVILLWTFGFIIMLNQRLNDELRMARDHFETIFKTNPDAAVITWLNNEM